MIIFAASNDKNLNNGTGINDSEDGFTVETEF